VTGLSQTLASYLNLNRNMNDRSFCLFTCSGSTGFDRFKAKTKLCMGEMRNIYKILSRKSEEKRPLGG